MESLNLFKNEKSKKEFLTLLESASNADHKVIEFIKNSPNLMHFILTTSGNDRIIADHILKQVIGDHFVAYYKAIKVKRSPTEQEIADLQSMGYLWIDKLQHFRNTEDRQASKRGKIIMIDRDLIDPADRYGYAYKDPQYQKLIALINTIKAPTKGSENGKSKKSKSEKAISRFDKDDLTLLFLESDQTTKEAIISTLEDLLVKFKANIKK